MSVETSGERNPRRRRGKRELLYIRSVFGRWCANQRRGPEGRFSCDCFGTVPLEEGPFVTHRLYLVVLYCCIRLKGILKMSRAPLAWNGWLLNGLQCSKVFSKIYFQKSFHHLLVRYNHVTRASFKAKFGSCHFKVIHFRLCNASVPLQRTIDMIFHYCGSFKCVCV